MTQLDTRLNAYRADLADLALAGRVDARRFVQGSPHRVTASQAPVREGPSLQAVQLSEALCGEAISVFEMSSDGWAWAQLQRDRYVGFVPAQALSAEAPAPTHKVSALRTLVFSAPDIKAPPLAGLPFGAEISVSGEAEDRNARYALLRSGGALVRQHLAPLDALESDWAAVAERFLGAPYLWGGKTSLGLDCSGLVQVALQACGFSAPRDTDMQERELGISLGSDVGPAQLERGDLVFWRGHVGIMLDERRMIHANALHMAVAIEPLRAAVDRLAQRGAPVSSIRRIEAR